MHHNAYTYAMAIQYSNLVKICYPRILPPLRTSMVKNSKVCVWHIYNSRIKSRRKFKFNSRLRLADLCYRNASCRDNSWASYFETHVRKQKFILYVYSVFSYTACIAYVAVSTIFAARCYASAAYVVMRCLCVRLCLSVTFVHFVKTKNVSSIFFTVG